MRPILEVSRELGLRDEDIETFGRTKAKVSLSALEGGPARAGRLVLVSAINPTAAGEGKTTLAIALAMGLRALGKRAVLALRQPSLGPVFGIKGGGTGGGAASLEPADDINLHFTGDMHAITSANNLLAALVDNALHFRLDLPGLGRLDPRAVTWTRALDMDDRALRHCVVGLGGVEHGVPRETSFDITAASEVMTVLSLAQSHEDLESRLSRIVVGSTEDGSAVTAAQLGAPGAMTALLRDALRPNLVQCTDGGPALVHCGPFANVAHGCSSVLASRMAVRFGDYAITEAGFGFDLGGEKFLDIKCRASGLWPRVVLVVVTLRALKMHGGAPLKEAALPSAERLERGIDHLRHHLAAVSRFGLPAVVAVNVFRSDPPEELAQLVRSPLGVPVVPCDGFVRGAEGAIELAREVARISDATDGRPPAPRFLYSLDAPYEDKVGAVARAVYGARSVSFTAGAEKQLRRIERLGYRSLPVCVAKTQLSLTDDPTVRGRPRDFDITVRSIRLCAGAGFVVAMTGELSTMPGLPREPAATGVHLNEDGHVSGLMHDD